METMNTAVPITYYTVTVEEPDSKKSRIMESLAGMGIKPEVISDASRARESLYTVVFLLGGDAWSQAARIACKALKSSLIVYTPETASGMLYIKDLMLSNGRRFHSVMISGDDDIGREFEAHVRGYRAAASASDLKVLLFGADYGGHLLEALEGLVEPDYYVLQWNDASTLIDEGIKYSSLYMDTYLAAYFDIKGKDEDKLAKNLGLYLAIKSVLDSEGANSVLLDCSRLYRSKGFTAWITLNLLLDEGIPASCTDKPQSLLIHAVSLALTGKPAWEAYSLKIKGKDLLLAGKLAPTLLFREVDLVERESYYELAGRIKQGEYTLVSISIRRKLFNVKLVNATQGNGREPTVIASGVGVEELLSDNVYLMPARDLHAARIAFEGLGFQLDG